MNYADIPLASIAFEGDARLQCLQMLSIDRLFRANDFPEYTIVLNGKDNVALRAFLASFADANISKSTRKKIKMVTFSDLLPGSTPRGYYDQQALKLALAPYYERSTQAPAYLMLDAKNHFVHNSTFNDFFADDKPKTSISDTTPYWQGYVERSLEAVGVRPEMGQQMMPSVTPYVMFVDQASKLLDALLDTHDPDPLLAIEKTRGTEFLLYYAQLLRSKSVDRYSFSGTPSVTLFTNWPQRSEDFDSMISRVQSREAIMFGLHRNRIPQLSESQRHAIKSIWRPELVPEEGASDWFLGTGLGDQYSGSQSKGSETSLRDPSHPSPKSIEVGVRQGAVIPESARVDESAILSAEPEKRIKLEKGVTIGEHCTIKGDAWLGDDCTISEGVFMSGDISIGRGAKIGANAVIVGKVRIGDRTVVEAESTLRGDIDIEKDSAVGRRALINGNSRSVGPPNKRGTDSSPDRVDIRTGSAIGDYSKIAGPATIGPGSVVDAVGNFCGVLQADTQFTRTDAGAWGLRSLLSTEVYSLPLGQTGAYGHGAPAFHIESPAQTAQGRGASRYQIRLSDESILDYFIANKQSDSLVVSFHGAVDRAEYHLPKFEWFNALTGLNESSMFVSDPALYSHPDLRLAWYLGTERLDLHKELASLIQQVANIIGANNIVLTGVSGGGFAALQVASFMDQATAVVFNPRTEIPILAGESGVSWQFHSFLTNVIPNATPSRASSDAYVKEWRNPLGDRISARLRFSREINSRVIYYSNMGDPFHASEYVPFRDQCHPGNRVLYQEYSGSAAHQHPSQEMMVEAIHSALSTA